MLENILNDLPEIGCVKPNKSGCKGVKLHKASGKWQAVIGYNYKRISLGYFNNKVDAIIARKMAEYKLGHYKKRA